MYILASRPRGALCIGVTSDIARRVWQHKTKAVKGHSARYGIDELVHVEVFGDAENAIRREKAMKKWNRAWKMRLVEQDNPEWCDLYDTLLH
ncbi:MAG: GIY-YIG nuclease family protein [Inquilinus sp.]|nr:GIY-YIG nuclease family protein [Inquilinus sp.]